MEKVVAGNAYSTEGLKSGFLFPTRAGTWRNITQGSLIIISKHSAGRLTTHVCALNHCANEASHPSHTNASHEVFTFSTLHPSHCTILHPQARDPAGTLYPSIEPESTPQPTHPAAYSSSTRASPQLLTSLVRLSPKQAPSPAQYNLGRSAAHRSGREPALSPALCRRTECIP